MGVVSRDRRLLPKTPSVLCLRSSREGEKLYSWWNWFTDGLQEVLADSLPSGIYSASFFVQLHYLIPELLFFVWMHRLIRFHPFRPRPGESALTLSYGSSEKKRRGMLHLSSEGFICNPSTFLLYVVWLYGCMFVCCIPVSYVHSESTSSAETFAPLCALGVRVSTLALAFSTLTYFSLSPRFPLGLEGCLVGRRILYSGFARWSAFQCFSPTFRVSSLSAILPYQNSKPYHAYLVRLSADAPSLPWRADLRFVAREIRLPASHPTVRLRRLAC